MINVSIKMMNRTHVPCLIFIPFQTFEWCHNRTFSCYINIKSNKYILDLNSKVEIILISPSGPKIHNLSIIFFFFWISCTSFISTSQSPFFFFFPSPGAKKLQQHILAALHRLTLALNGLIPSIFDLNNIFTHCLHFIGPLKVTRQFKPVPYTSAECPKKVFEKHFKSCRHFRFHA